MGLTGGVLMGSHGNARHAVGFVYVSKRRVPNGPDPIHNRSFMPLVDENYLFVGLQESRAVGEVPKGSIGRPEIEEWGWGRDCRFRRSLILDA
ncbi:hypothetical protein HPP92_017911 [Vanilla planifolia]|uniref:Uncharacterized protein n=1 Tax=Vanilla planifolia TaxID=51239 RepID=A0A835QDM6_VANPL|nr:hypothetical protein HPP92_018488 [Vanilla planifolia]KAG0468583.1 hypothetical protein HPP92_017911 [Vanilla planifolia]